jgi:CRP-like cAMP-binding protein
MYDELKFWFLKEHELFKALNSSQIKQLCIIVGYKRAKKGEVLYFASSEAPRIFFLKTGTIKIMDIDSNGNETIKDIIQKGDLFGELELSSDCNSNERAVALTDDVSICSFLMTDFENLLLQNPSMAVSYTKFVGTKMRRIRNRYTNLVSKDARTRLVTFLKDWAFNEGVNDENRFTIDNYLTQNDIAQLICTSRQTATILLNDLEQEGLIQYNRKELIIEDILKLD